jgi:hypothetical protein
MQGRAHAMFHKKNAEEIKVLNYAVQNFVPHVE